MTLLIIQHNESNHPRLLSQVDMDVKIHRADLDLNMPRLKNVTGLIVMGGPQSAYTDLGFPSRQGEIQLIQDALDKHIPILGVCLGSQLLAVAAGGECYRREQAEDGWYPVALTSQGSRDPLFEGVTSVFTPKHRHDDSFHMPPGAVRLASSERCLEQGFRLGDRAWGLQFHFEMEPAKISAGETNVTYDIEREKHVAALAPTAKRIVANFASIVETSCHQFV